MNPGSPIDEYKIACEFLWGYATLRFLSPHRGIR